MTQTQSLTTEPQTDKGKDIPHSSLYTWSVWHKAKLPCAELIQPPGAHRVYKITNIYMFLIRLFNPSIPSLKATLLHRHTAINKLLAASHTEQVIEIAAGYSPRGIFQSKNSDRQYFEIDLIDTVNNKVDLLYQSAEGREALKRQNYNLRSGDIQNMSYIRQFPLCHSFVITEGLMMYFDRVEQIEIWKKIAQFINTVGGEYVFDFSPADYRPKPNLFRRTWRKIKFKKDARHQDEDEFFRYDSRTLDSVISDLRLAGFKNVDSYCTTDIAKSWSLPLQDTFTNAIIFHCKA